MQEKIITKEELSNSIKNVMSFETEDIFKKVINALLEGKSVLLDAVSYIGNGRYVDRGLKKRYKYKLIAPILDNNNNLYSTDLYEGGAERAIKGEYGIYRATRQLCVDFISEIEPDYNKERFDFGYKNEEYGIYKIIIRNNNEKIPQISN